MSEIFYPISGTNAVGLTFEEEIDLAKRWTLKQDRAARDILFKNYLLFTVKQVKKMYSSLSEDDAILVAHEALIESVNKFDPFRAKLGRLSNLIPYYAKVAFRNFRRRAETVKCPVKEATPEGGRYVSTNTDGRNRQSSSPAAFTHNPSGADGDGEDYKTYNDADCSLDDLFGTADSAAEEFDLEERKEIIIVELAKLPETLRDVITLVYYEGLNFADIARRSQPEISREAVRQKHNRAMALLREGILKLDIFRK